MSTPVGSTRWQPLALVDIRWHPMTSVVDRRPVGTQQQKINREAHCWLRTTQPAQIKKHNFSKTTIEKKKENACVGSPSPRRSKTNQKQQLQCWMGAGGREGEVLVGVRLVFGWVVDGFWLIFCSFWSVFGLSLVVFWLLEAVFWSVVGEFLIGFWSNTTTTRGRARELEERSTEHGGRRKETGERRKGGKARKEKR